MLKAKFIKSVYDVNKLPKDKLPEVVLCGRSNVGKSSFINSLFIRKNLAKTSSTPGKTRSLNYYNINNKFYMVDLPGFGYAKVAVKEKDVWRKLIESYFDSSSSIQLAIHLIDSRHPPTNLDILLNSLLKEKLIPYNILLAKSDKLNQSEKSKSIKVVSRTFPELILGDNLFFYSSLTGFGRKELEIRLSKLFL
jgi:GTP-binding protein